MTDYAVHRKAGRWSLLREGREIAVYPTRAEALSVAGRLRAVLLGVSDPNAPPGDPEA